MRRTIQSRKMDEIFARLDAEDRIVKYLSKFPPEVALATALRVEVSLATRWEERQNDPREVVQIYATDFKEVNAAIAKIPPGIQSDDAAEQHVIRILADFPPDWAWWIARKVARFEANWARMKATQGVS
jgi:hypothetical protein